MKNRYLYLVRHGQYQMDEEAPGEFLHLTDLGWEQARQTANALVKELPYLNGIYCSTMVRAYETASVIADSFNCSSTLKRKRVLCECFPSLTEKLLSNGSIDPDLSFDDVRKKLALEPSYRNELELLFEKKYGWKPDSEAADKAFEQFFIRSRNQEKHDILVCHGNIIRYFVTKAINCMPELWANMAVHNCAITVIRVSRKGSVILEKYNDNSHLKKADRTMM